MKLTRQSSTNCEGINENRGSVMMFISGEYEKVKKTCKKIDLNWEHYNTQCPDYDVDKTYMDVSYLVDCGDLKSFRESYKEAK